MDTLKQVIDRACENYGQLTDEDVAVIAEHDRLRMLLIRWGQGRALVPAQSVIDIIEATGKGGWNVRDVSLPTSDPAMKGKL